MVTCSFCGAVAQVGADDGSESVPITWSKAVENGQPKVFCERCSREHLRAMESKLDSEWW